MLLGVPVGPLAAITLLRKHPQVLTINEDTINVDVAGVVLVPLLVDVDIRLHAREKAVAISAVDVAKSLNVAVAIQLGKAGNVVGVGDSRSRAHVRTDNNLKVDIGVRGDGVVQRLPRRRAGVDVQREQDGESA